MFLGEILALGFYFLHKAQNPQGYARRASEAQAEGKLLHFNKLKFAIPALCDVMASNLQLFALNFIAGSVYQMMRGGTIITTFIFSLLILKIKAKPFQIVGSALAFIGIAVVGVAAMVFGGSEETETEVVVFALLSPFKLQATSCWSFRFSSTDSSSRTSRRYSIGTTYSR